jgi:hypothetical protein
VKGSWSSLSTPKYSMPVALNCHCQHKEWVTCLTILIDLVYTKITQSMYVCELSVNRREYAGSFRCGIDCLMEAPLFGSHIHTYDMKNVCAWAFNDVIKVYELWGQKATHLFVKCEVQGGERYIHTCICMYGCMYTNTFMFRSYHTRNTRIRMTVIQITFHICLTCS